ncbi:MAG: hypothetical protein M1820_005245 [Bogoriella megaspora]|nr:MAG: hypothetical protein M1820_005245 [Bogoriella megaspora]
MASQNPPPRVFVNEADSYQQMMHHVPSHSDHISVNAIQASLDCFPDAFGRQKPQPALISVRLTLREHFDSASKEDQLDGSTVNYGTVSKAIREVTERKTADGSLRAIRQFWPLIGDAISHESVRQYDVDLFFPKASTTGDGIGFRKSWISGTEDGPFSFSVYFKNMRARSLIGVNDHERTKKQPVVATVWADLPNEQLEDHDASHLIRIEEIIVETIEASAFATLEALAVYVTNQIVDSTSLSYSSGGGPIIGIGVKLEKPLAIPFADAPSVEIYRKIV